MNHMNLSQLITELETQRVKIDMALQALRAVMADDMTEETAGVREGTGHVISGPVWVNTKEAK